MSLALNQAIGARVRGIEVLTGRAADAQSTLAGILAAAGSSKAPAIRYGAKASSTVYPEITFREDAGPQTLGGPDVGIVQDSVYRFELWDNSRDGSTIPTIADCLELLFDVRRDAPAINLTGYGKVYASYLLTALQGPFHDDIKKVFFGLIAFRFAEARP